MRRKDLKVGMVVDYVASAYRRQAGILVIFTEPWCSGYWTAYHGPLKSKTSFRPAMMNHDERDMVAVAVPRRNGEWVPNLLRLNTLKPAGTVERLEAEERKAREARWQADELRQRRQKDLAARVGIDFLYIDSMGRVSIRVDLLEKLLDERDRLQGEIVHYEKLVQDLAHG